MKKNPLLDQISGKQKASVEADALINSRKKPGISSERYDKYSSALDKITRTTGQDAKTIITTNKTKQTEQANTIPSIAINDSVLSISSFASSIDKDRDLFNGIIGNIIGQGLNTDVDNYTEALSVIKKKETQRIKESFGLNSRVDTFIESVGKLDDDTKINDSIIEGSILVHDISEMLKEFQIDTSEANNSEANNDSSYEFLVLLRRKVNANLVYLRRRLLKIEQNKTAELKRQDPHDIYDKTLTNTITGLGIIYNGLSYAVSNSLITLYFIKKTLGQAAEKATNIAATNIDKIITNAEKTIFEVMYGLEDLSSAESIAYTGRIKSRYGVINAEIESLIIRVSAYINQHQNEFDDSEFLSNLYDDVLTGGEHVNFLNKGNDALFLFMEYMRENSNKPVAEQKEISGDVVATMIQLLSLNGEKVALTGVSAPSASFTEGDVIELNGEVVPLDEALTQTNGGRRTRRRGVRRSIKSNKKSKRARGRKTRRAKRKQSTERRRR